MFTVQCSSCKRGQKGVFETGFHLTSKIFAAISLNIFFVCVSACVPECVCVTHFCMAALVAALFAADGRKNNENTKQRQVESASPRFDFALASCVAYFKAPGRLRLLLVSLPLTSSSITGCSVVVVVVACSTVVLIRALLIVLVAYFQAPCPYLSPAETVLRV